MPVSAALLCAARGCANAKVEGLPLCRRCWVRLPVALQNRVLVAQRAMRTGGRAALKEWVRVLRLAREAAGEVRG